MSHGSLPLLCLVLAVLLLPGAASAWVIPLTSDSADQQNPSISGQKIVWQDDRNGNWDVYLYDYATQTERRLTDDPMDQVNPRIAGDRVVWEDYRNSGAYENPDIYLLDLTTDQEQMLNLPESIWGGYERQPAIDGDVVVWYESANGISECGRTFYRYLDRPDWPKQAFQDSNTQSDPDVSGQKVVWTDVDLGGVYFRYLLDSNTYLLERMSNDTVRGLRISGDRIVWSQYVPESMTYNIRLCALDITMTNGTKSWLSPGGSFQTDPAIDGNLVVWCDDRNGNTDLYLYDFAAGAERPMVVAEGNQVTPDVDGEYVVFTDDRDGDNEIYLATVPAATPAVAAVPGGTGAPRDLDSNGKYEDVNGNGRKDFADVVLYFNQMTWIGANEPLAAFDYNGNNRIDFADTVQLFNAL